MCYICTDEHKMWPQHSVRKWEVRKANMTGNNLLQKKPNQTRWFVEPLYHFLHAKKIAKFIPVRDTQKEQWGQTRPPCFKQEYMQLHAIHFYLLNANFQHWWSQCTAQGKSPAKPSLQLKEQAGEIFRRLSIRCHLCWAEVGGVELTGVRNPNDVVEEAGEHKKKGTQLLLGRTQTYFILHFSHYRLERKRTLSPSIHTLVSGT